jgi:hypothetical protein
MSTIIIYTVENCPNCEKLKERLNGFGIEYEERNIETIEAIIDLRCLGCFPQEAPVLRVGKNYYESTDFFKGFVLYPRTYSPGFSQKVLEILLKFVWLNGHHSVCQPFLTPHFITVYC